MLGRFCGWLSWEEKHIGAFCAYLDGPREFSGGRKDVGIESYGGGLDESGCEQQVTQRRLPDVLTDRRHSGTCPVSLCKLVSKNVSTSIRARVT